MIKLFGGELVMCMTKIEHIDKKSEELYQVIKQLKEQKRYVTIISIQEETGLDRKTVENLLFYLAGKDKIVLLKAGRQWLIDIKE